MLDWIFEGIITWVSSVVTDLMDAVENAKNELAPESISDAMKSVVPTFHDPREINDVAENAEEMKMVNV